MGLLSYLGEMITGGNKQSPMGGLLAGGQQPRGLLGSIGPTPFNPDGDMVRGLGGVNTGSAMQQPAPAENDGFKQALMALTDAVGNWGKTPQEIAQTELLRAQAAAQRNQIGPFGGDSFDNQLVRQRAREYIQAGYPQQEAISRAANDVLGTKQDYVADPSNPGALIPVGRKALPPISGQTQAMTQMVPVVTQLPQGGQGAGMTLRGPNGEAAMPTSGGPLLPPPS